MVRLAKVKITLEAINVRKDKVVPHHPSWSESPVIVMSIISRTDPTDIEVVQTIRLINEWCTRRSVD